MIRTRIEVRNMACEMCEAHVIEAVRKILSHGEARRIRASHRRNEVTIESEAPLSESLVRECIRSIGETGYPTGAASSEEVKQGLLARRLSPPSPSLAAIRQVFSDIRRETVSFFVEIISVSRHM